VLFAVKQYRIEGIIQARKAQLQKGHKKGFTLVELIVVIVILGILLAISIPALTGYISKAQDEGLKSEGRTLEVAFQTLASDMHSVTLNDASKHPTEGDLTAASGKTVGAGATAVADHADWVQAANNLASTTYDATKVTIKIQYDAGHKVVALLFGKVDPTDTTTSTKWAYYNGETWSVFTSAYSISALKLADDTTAFAPTQP
jgi:prepilin-type N-terminal cleavage/methylation domain-containing protein